MGRTKKCGRCNKAKRPKSKKKIKGDGYCKCGKPEKIAGEVLHKLESAFRIGLSDRKACAYAEIANATLYAYQKKNPEFAERKARLKLQPDIMAHQTAVKSLSTPQYAWRWLERKDPDFVPKKEIKDTSERDIIDPKEIGDEEKNALQALRQARKARLRKEVMELED